MGKKKLQHFAEMETFGCMFQPSKAEMVSGAHHMKGKWKSDYFKNDHPITLELGCGKGEYAIALARKYPERNFIGVDVKGARLWRGGRTAEDEKLANVAFIRTKIEFITTFFAPAEVAEIWLTFSDPQIGDHKGSKRLSGEAFLTRYREFLAPKHLIHVKTDSAFLRKCTAETIATGGHVLHALTADLYGSDFEKFSEEEREILAVKTFYEEKYLMKGIMINYVKFSLSDGN
jgi:tRNA (guanine-N7-)-methyltransferase